MPDSTDDLKDHRPGARTIKKPTGPQKKWELAQTYMKSKDIDSARKVLTELTDRSNPYHARATKMLKEIEE
jgi:FimV-like protein